MSSKRARAVVASLWLAASLVLLAARASLAGEDKVGPSQGRSGRLEKDETWSGRVVLTGDVYIPPGRTLVVEPGSTIDPVSGRSLWNSKLSRKLRGAVREVTHPGLVDIIVEGTLRFEGSWLSGISLADLEEQRPSSWGGLVIVNKGKVEIRYASIYLADTAVALYDQSEANIVKTTFKSNLAAIEAFHQSSLTVKDSTLSANPAGVNLYDDTRARIEDSWFRFNTSAILIADRSTASVKGNVLFKNIVALSSLDSTRPQIRANYFLANRTGIRLGQRTVPSMDRNWSLLEKERLVDEREADPRPPSKFPW